MIKDGEAIIRTIGEDDSRLQKFLARIESHHAPDMKALKIYTEFKITAAVRSWECGDNIPAIRDFKMAAQACFFMEDMARGINLLDKAELIKYHQENHENVHGAYDKYFVPLEQKMSVLENDNDYYQACNVLKQMIGISKAAGYASLTKRYKKRLTVMRRLLFKKNANNSHVENAVRSTFIISLKLAYERAELAFRYSNWDQLQPVMPILVSRA